MSKSPAYPNREEDLQERFAGVGKNDCRGILEAVMQACSLPVDEWPEAVERDIDPPQVGIIANLLGAVLADQCTRMKLTTGLVATSQDVKLLVLRTLEKGTGPGRIAPDARLERKARASWIAGGAGRQTGRTDRQRRSRCAV